MIDTESRLGPTCSSCRWPINDCQCCGFCNRDERECVCCIACGGFGAVPIGEGRYGNAEYVDCHVCSKVKP